MPHQGFLEVPPLKAILIKPGLSSAPSTAILLRGPHWTRATGARSGELPGCLSRPVPAAPPGSGQDIWCGPSFLAIV